MLVSVAAHYHVLLPDTTTILRLVWMYDAVQEDLRERAKQREADARARRT